MTTDEADEVDAMWCRLFDKLAAIDAAQTIQGEKQCL